MTCWTQSWRSCQQHLKPRKIALASCRRRKESAVEAESIRRDRASAHLDGEESNDQRPAANDAPPHETKVAIIGHPNVGKSTLLNCLTASDRAIVSPVPGTTRDAVDEVVEHNGRSFRFIDTAGIRRKGKTHLMAEKLSVVMARKHLEGADIALLVIDATEGVSQLDASIAGYAHESGRSIIIVVNKWDLVISGKAESRRGPRRPSACARASAPAIAKPTKNACATISSF